MNTYTAGPSAAQSESRPHTHVPMLCISPSHAPPSLLRAHGSMSHSEVQDEDRCQLLHLIMHAAKSYRNPPMLLIDRQSNPSDHLGPVALGTALRRLVDNVEALCKIDCVPSVAIECNRFSITTQLPLNVRYNRSSAAFLFLRAQHSRAAINREHVKGMGCIRAL